MSAVFTFFFSPLPVLGAGEITNIARKYPGTAQITLVSSYCVWITKKWFHLDKYILINAHVMTKFMQWINFLTDIILYLYNSRH